MNEIYVCTYKIHKIHTIFERRDWFFNCDVTYWCFIQFETTEMREHRIIIKQKITSKRMVLKKGINENEMKNKWINRQKNKNDGIKKRKNKMNIK